MKLIHILLLFFGLTIPCIVLAQLPELAGNNITWTSQSNNSSESMPCGGGDIGLNVWVEKDDLLFYIARAGVFDENNGALKSGRVRIKLSPNPFAGNDFKQELNLQQGHVTIKGSNGLLTADIKVWVDVFGPVIHVDIKTSKAIKATAAYESWRISNRISKGDENKANTWKHMYPGEVTTYADTIGFQSNSILFYHQNRDITVFDSVVSQQGLLSVKEQLYNPLKNLVFGGKMLADNMHAAGTYTGKYVDTDFQGWKLESDKASRSHHINVYLHNAQAQTIENWQEGLQQVISYAEKNKKAVLRKTLDWWQQFWNRSFIFIQPQQKDDSSAAWQVGRN